MTTDDLKIFHLNRSMFAANVRVIEDRYNLNVLPAEVSKEGPHDAFFAQFPQALRDSALQMARHYEVFYCLENFIRDVVIEQLKSLHGEDWWKRRYPRASRTTSRKT